MATWSFVLTPGGDITSSVDIPSVKKDERLFSELRPNVNSISFRAAFSSALLGTLLANQAPALAVTKDGTAYFTGYLSPNWATSIKYGQKLIELRAEDPTLIKLGQTIVTTLAYPGYSVCNPASPATSLVHVLAAAAGVTLAAGAPTISATIPYIVILASDKMTYAQVLSDLLYEYLYVYYFNASGELTLTPSVNSGAITTTSTFDIATNAGNIRESLNIQKSQVKYDDVRVNFQKVVLKAGMVLFQDTEGAAGNLAAHIQLEANSDPSKKDYYPRGSDAVEVFAEWKSPDGYEIFAATSAALDTTVDAGISLSRSFTNYYRRASFAYHNTGAAPAFISKMRITGDAYVITEKNVARFASSGKQLLDYQAKYIFDTASAQSLAQGVGQYYAYSDIVFSFKSQADVAVGSYALISDSVWGGISQKCRVIGKSKSEQTKSYEYTLEAVADFAAISLVLEGAIPAVYSNTLDAVTAMSSDAIITPQEKAALMIRWADISGNGSTSGSYWQTRSTLLQFGISTDTLDYYYGILYGLLYGASGVLLPATWNQNIIIGVASLATAWANYYQGESQSLTTISKYASFGGIIALDCGDWSSVVSDYAPELDGGYYTIGEEDVGIWDLGDYSVASEDLDIFCGDYDGSVVTDIVDMGDFIPNGIAIPDVIVDCGDF